MKENIYYTGFTEFSSRFKPIEKQLFDVLEEIPYSLREEFIELSISPFEDLPEDYKYAAEILMYIHEGLSSFNCQRYIRLDLKNNFHLGYRLDWISYFEEYGNTGSRKADLKKHIYAQAVKKYKNRELSNMQFFYFEVRLERNKYFDATEKKDITGNSKLIEVFTKFFETDLLVDIINTTEMFYKIRSKKVKSKRRRK